MSGEYERLKTWLEALGISTMSQSIVVEDGEARPSEKDVVEFYTLAVKLLDEVSKIEPRC